MPRSASNEYSVTVIDRSKPASEVNKTFTSDNEPTSLLTHSMFNLDTPLYPITPDLPDRCPQCGFHIRMSLKYDHTLFHKALSTLGYSGSDWPTEVGETLERRQKLVQQYVDKLRRARKAADGSKKAQYRGKFIELINELNIAFSLVKLYVEDEYEIGQKPHSTVVISGKTNISVPTDGKDKCVLLAALLNEQNNRWQTHVINHSAFIDDVMLCQLYDVDQGKDLNIDHRIQCVGLYSGYRGEAAAQRCYLKLHEVLSTEMSKLYSGNTDGQKQIITEFDDSCLKSTRSNLVKVENHPYCEQVKQSFENTFEEMDKLICMGEDEFGSVRWSGCSASVAMLENINDVTLLHIANCGDNRIVACRNGEAVRLSKVHTLNSPSERQRIKASQDCYEHLKKLKTTQASRGLGNYGDKLMRQCVVPVPSCTSYVISDEIEFVLFGSRALFGVLSETQCIRICKSVLPKYFFEVKQTIEEKILSDVEQEEANKNKTVTFRSASQLQEVHAPTSKSELELIVGSNQSEINEANELNQNQVDESKEENTEDVKEHPMTSPELGNKENLRTSESTPDDLNAVADGDDSDEGSSIVSSVQTHSSNGSRGRPKSKKPSECEVFKGVSIKDLRAEVSSVNLDSTTEWKNYLPSMAKNICEKLCLSAMKNGSKENISCAIIFLPGIQKQLNVE